MKVMISQPMNGKTNEQINKEREEVKNKLENCGWEVVDTVFCDYEKDKDKVNIPVFYLAKSIDAMSKVDAVLFMNNWDKSRGCIIEHEICLRYDILMMYEYEL